MNWNKRQPKICDHENRRWWKTQQLSDDVILTLTLLHKHNLNNLINNFINFCKHFFPSFLFRFNFGEWKNADRFMAEWPIFWVEKFTCRWTAWKCAIGLLQGRRKNHLILDEHSHCQGIAEAMMQLPLHFVGPVPIGPISAGGHQIAPIYSQFIILH